MKRAPASRRTLLPAMRTLLPTMIVVDLPADPTTETENALATVLAEILGLEHVDADAHVFDDLGADSMVMARFCARVRKRDDLPSVSMKDVYRHPTIRRLAAALAPAPEAHVESPVAGMLAEVLASVMRRDEVAADAHFFNDLGADSMVMAGFCARVRKRDDLPSVTMKDVYRHPTIGSLAAALTETAPAPARVAPAPAAAPAPATPAAPAAVVRRGSRLQYVLCGALQFLFYIGASLAAGYAFTRGYDWISAGSGLVDAYERSVVFGAATLLGMCLLPIVAKWLLIGRWRQREIRIWSLGYVRFWLVKMLIRANPMVLLFGGSPIQVLYLRALGAKVGPRVTILSRHLPLCTDMLAIGAGTVIRKDAVLCGYRARAGMIETGPVTLGRDVLVGEKAVLDIDTSMGDSTQLGHASSLQSGQAVPAGEHWHGSPAQRADADYATVAPARCGAVRRTVYSMAQVVRALAVTMPLLVAVIGLLFDEVPRLMVLLGSGSATTVSWGYYRAILAVSSILFFGLVIAGLLLMTTVPRLLNLAIRADRVYPLYGLRWAAHKAITRTTNGKFFTNLFGDSSYIVPYLRCLGYDLPDVVQTGSNFGTVVTHDTPYLTTVGSGTMVADGLSVINTEFSNTSFRVSRVAIGSRNFLGNHIAYHSQGRTGDNCLLATKVMVPIDGPVRQDVGLLGSPSFEIPRSVERDSRLAVSGAALRRRLQAKNLYNLRTIALFLMVRWLYVLGFTVLVTATATYFTDYGVEAIAGDIFLTPVYSLLYFVLVERAVTRFRPLQPQYCSIYDPYFWWHERYWKFESHQLDRMFDGTPFKPIVGRLRGLRIGTRVFDDGCGITERSLTTIGDDCALNFGSVIQPHSQEDGAFKSAAITIGAGCTLGIGALVHYGTTMGDGAELAPDAFLMKGQEVPPHTCWVGNPAEEVRERR